MKDELMELREENEALRIARINLNSQREALNKDNIKLRRQLSELRAECDAELNAKELEKVDIMDELHRTAGMLDEANRTIDELKSNTNN